MEANHFHELLQISLGSRNSFSGVPLAEEWIALYDESEKQSVSGIMLAGIERLPKAQRPPQELLLQWIGVGQMIEQQNKQVNERCVDIVKVFAESGFKSCILKGQGNSLMYPNPMLRQSGDIDIWVEGSKDDIVSFVHEKYPNATVTEHHVEFPIYEDVEVEVHYKPSVAVSVKYDKRFEKYWDSVKDEQFSHKGSLSNSVGDICLSLSDDYLETNILDISQHVKEVNPKSQIDRIINAWLDNPSIVIKDELVKYNMTLVYPMMVIFDDKNQTYDDIIKEVVEYINREYPAIVYNVAIPTKLFFMLLPVKSSKAIKTQVLSWIDTKEVLI